MLHTIRWSGLAALLSMLACLAIPSAVSPQSNTGESNKSASAGTGSISGSVKDATGAVLTGAKVTLKPTATFAAADAQGDFRIQNLRPGTYQVTVSDVGFKDFVTTVTVTGGQNTLVNPTMLVSSTSQSVVVTAELQGDVAAINEQRTSENILDVMPAATIQNLPNQSVATVLGRMPGVTVQINEGEPQYVQIRGTEPRLSNTTIDGIVVPGPDPQVREVDLWVIPGDLVGDVEINKTLSANQDADAIGGSVNLDMRQATSSQPTLDLESLGGWNPIDTGQPWIRDDATFGKRFGAHERYGFMVSYSYDLNDLGTDDVEPVPAIDPTGGAEPYFNAISIRQYFYNHTRFGFGGSTDYKLSQNSDLFVHGIYSNFRDFGERYNYDISSAVPAFGGNPAQPGNIVYGDSVRRPNYLISDLIVGGNQVFGRAYIKYAAAVSRSRFGGAAGNPGANFQGVNSSLGSTCTFATGPSIYRPQFPCAASDPIHDPNQYALQNINLTTGQSMQINLQGNGSMGFNYNLGTHASTFEFGGLVRNAHKGQYAFSPTYDCQNLNGAGQPQSPCPPNFTPPLMSQFTTNFTDPSYYGGSYRFGPVTAFERIQDWLEKNPGVLPLDEGATHLNSDPANYNLQERISAGYVMNTVELGSKFHLQTGLRIEGTNESNTGYQVINDANGNYLSTQPVSASGSYVDFMPSVQLRYNIDQNSDIRAVYGRGISRPDPYDLVPYKTLDESTTPNSESIGNPALLAEHANDYDLLYERYLPSVGMIEAGYFYKDLTQPLFQTETTIPNPFPNPVTPNVLLTQWVNGGHAHVQGVELAYKQHLTFLPGVLSAAQIDANMTYTNSRSYGVPYRTDVPPLVGQAPFFYNISPTYETKRAIVSMGISYDGPYIATYQYENEGPNAVPGGVTGPFGDNYYYERTQVDAQASYYMGRGFTFAVQGENLNNALLGFYNGDKYHMTQREYYKPIYSGGIRWSLGRREK
jgi:TonB-dependent receptor